MASRKTPALALAIVGLLTAAVSNLDRAKELWQAVFPPPVLPGPPLPATNDKWAHDYSKDPAVLENILALNNVDSSKLVANCTLGGSIHIWYQPGTGNAHFKYREVPWRNEKNPSMNFFYNDGKIVPIGWPRTPTKAFAYFEVQ